MRKVALNSGLRAVALEKEDCYFCAFMSRCHVQDSYTGPASGTTQPMTLEQAAPLRGKPLNSPVGMSTHLLTTCGLVFINSLSLILGILSRALSLTALGNPPGAKLEGIKTHLLTRGSLQPGLRFQHLWRMKSSLELRICCSQRAYYSIM